MKIQLLQISIIFFLFSTLQLQSEASKTLQGQVKLDSLLKELPKMKEDTNGVNLLTQISFEYRNIDPDKGVFYGKKGLNISNEIKWDFGQSTCYRSLGLNYLSKSNYPKALESFYNALKIDEKTGYKFGIAKTYINIGIVYSFTKNYPKALESFNKSLELLEELGKREVIASTYNNIGSLYGQQYNYSLALEYFQKALVIDEEIGNISGKIKDLANIGTIYATQKNYSKAIENLKKVLDYLNKVGNSRAKVAILGNIGHIYLRMALDSNSNKSEYIINSTLEKEVNLNNSIEYLNSSIVLSKEIGDLDGVALSLFHLSDAYIQKSDYKKAFETYKEYKTLKDSVFSSENQTKIANLEAKRESDVKQKEIEILKKEKENEKLQRYAMFAGIAGLGIIIGLILIQRRKSEKLLLNVLPAKIAKRLKAKEHPIADHFDGASIIFIDIVGFTKLSSDADPKRIVSVLNDIFTIFDKLADKYGLEKIKTIGDSYMAVCGIPEINPDHAKQAARMALEVKKIMTGFTTSDGTEIHFRIGIDCGAVVAGVIGEKKFIYDLWSDSVNTASRMESTGEKGQIQITENFKEELEKYAGDWNFTLRGEFEIKGKGLMKTYFLD